MLAIVDLLIWSMFSSAGIAVNVRNLSKSRQGQSINQSVRSVIGLGLLFDSCFVRLCKAQ